MNNKIDFVMIWVDGNDKKWQEEKNKYSTYSGDNRNIRYRDWDNLKYWFRGIEKYANWVNKIYFVTYGHIPKWLDINNDKIKIINHKDFIPKEYLPTFSSHVIELNLHRIKGLSEQFVYFNDDIFIINNTKKEDFFLKGLPRDSAILSPAINEDKNGIGNVELNNMSIINTYFKKNRQIRNKLTNWFNIKYELSQNLKNILLMPWNSFTSFYEFHLCNSFLKKTYSDIWNKEEKTLDEVCKHRFRNLKLDNNQWLIRDWQLVNNNFIPRSTKFGKLYTIDGKTDISKILNSKHKVICLNDSDKLSEEDFNKYKEEIIYYLEKKFPEKSSFEK